MSIRLSKQDWDALAQKNPNMRVTPLDDSPVPNVQGEVVTKMDELKSKLAEIDGLVKSGTITDKRGEVWKNRIIDEFELTVIPAEVEKKLPTGLSYLPGRIIAGSIDAMKAIAKGSGATYQGLSKQYDRGNERGSLETGPIRGMKMPPAAKKTSNVIDLYNDLPEMYK